MLRGEAGARLHEARVALRDRDREARRRPARARRARARRVRTRTGPGRRRRCRRAPGRRPRRAAAGSAARSGALPPLGVGDQERRVAAELAPGQARDHEHALGRVLARLDRRAERIQLGEAAALLVREQQPDSSKRPANCSAIRAFSSSSPSPVTAETCGASGKRLSSRRRPNSSTRVDLVQHELHRQLRGADLAAAPPPPRRPSSRAGPPGRRRRRRAAPCRRRASPRASPRSPRRAGAAGGG